MGINNFPHAFVTVHGTLDATGEQVDAAYGFTAKAISPAILFGSVAGEVLVEPENEAEHSDRHFALTLTDDQYRAAMTIVDEWRHLPQPSYNLNRRNCVHFVGAVAEAVGLRVEYVRNLMKRPRSFLDHVRELNPQLAGR